MEDQLAPNVRNPNQQTFAYAAFVWSVVFLVPHVYWAAGSTVGLDGQSMDGVLAAINYAAIILSIIAAALALALVRPWGALLPHRLLLIGAWGACALLSLRGDVGLIQALVVWVGGSDSELTTLGLIFEPLFLVGGILFGLAARQYRRDR